MRGKDEMDKKKEILGLIPARGGSKGLPGKNIRPLDGIPLIAHTILKAKKSRYITRLIVVTDSDDIAQVAKDYGAEVPFQRPEELSTDTSRAFELYKYIIEWFKQNEGYRPDILCTMLCTTPFRTTSDIDSCLWKMITYDYDWCFTINEIEHHPYRAMKIVDDQIRPLFDIDKSVMWANRQELPTLYRFNGGVIVGKTSHIENYSEYNIDNLAYATTRVGYSPMPARRAIDIDTVEDLMFAELLMKEGKIDE